MKMVEKTSSMDVKAGLEELDKDPNIYALRASVRSRR